VSDIETIDSRDFGGKPSNSLIFIGTSGNVDKTYIQELFANSRSEVSQPPLIKPISDGAVLRIYGSVRQLD